MTDAGTVRAALSEGTRRLAAAGVENPGGDARLLLASVLEGDRLTLLREAESRLESGLRARFDRAIERRAAGRPVSRILRRRWFWGLDFEIDDHVLDPRPESESLIEAVLDRVEGEAPLHILDLGTGSGCLLLALLSELEAARGLGIDIDPAALVRARANAEALGLAARAEFRRGDWGAGLDARFDIILANPPYVRSGEIDGLAPEVARHDPRRALDGGPDGLDAYRAIAPWLARLLAPGGLAAIECGAGQAPAVAGLVAQAGLPATATRADLAGIDRCLLAAAEKESIARSNKRLE